LIGIVRELLWNMHGGFRHIDIVAVILYDEFNNVEHD